MILRRVIQHVKKQEWTAIWIDLVIVVVGVFIGIQVANWNEARLEAQRAQGFLERISSDLEKELASIDKSLEYVGRSLAYGEAALTWIEEGTLASGSAWQTVLAFFQASRIQPYSPVDTTYQEMRSDGELGLVRDIGLRAALTEYYVSGTLARADYILKLNPLYRGHVRGLTPFRITRYISSECFDVVAVRTKPCAAPVDEATSREVLRRYTDDPSLQIELAFWVDSAYLHIGILRKFRADCVKLKHRIDARLDG